jgi:hypothetical protein
VRGFLDNDEPLSGEIKGRLKDLTRIARAEFVDEVLKLTGRAQTSSPKLVQQQILTAPPVRHRL